jgi:hypothetical protein
VQVYEELANLQGRRGDAQLRDRFLMLAADAALTAGQTDQAERLRGRLLQVNPHHLLKPYRSLAEGMRSPDVKSYLENLRQTCPPEAAEQLLAVFRAENSTLKDEPTQALAPSEAVDAEATEELPIYRFQDNSETAEAALPAAPSLPPPKSTQSSNRSKPAAPVAQAYPLMPSQGPSPWRSKDAPRAEPPSYVGGFWVAGGLFVLVLATALALAGYVMTQPFLPSLGPAPARPGSP